ncbi:MAG TPA: PQQ-dependent sugar dehydrogenase [Gemmatimonadaceae bacterium]|nr:PQQ-dependent sugar dehydrogenase [Gemmatimonadaceae bacterium]
MMNPRYVIIAGTTLVAGGILLGVGGRGAPPMQAEGFNATVITTGLDTPWDLAWGTDGMIWVSERGGRVSRVDPATGRRSGAGEVAGVLESGEGGLMGIALHPDFARDPWLYAMHTYESPQGTRNRLVRLRWNGSTLGGQQVLLDDIPGGGIHNGARVVVGRDRMLYVSTGDAGNASVSQDSTSTGGKILRVHLDGRTPADNPFGSVVWSWGHRNGQGLVVHPRTGVIYETEHGSGDNDEVNIIERGRNYGWPNVRGACDDTSEREFCREQRVVEPLASWTPTVAITGADLYLSDRAPALRNSLLATSLSGRALWRLKLSADGARITERAVMLSGIYGRLRDVLVAPNGDIYLATSNRDGRGSPADNDDRIIRLTPR